MHIMPQASEQFNESTGKRSEIDSIMSALCCLLTC